MKLSSITLWCLGAAGCASLLHADPGNPYTASGPETTLDSIWAAAGHVQTFTETIDSQLGMYRFQEEGQSRFWFSGMGSFGDARAKSDHPAFDYYAGGGALGYDYCRSGDGAGALLGGALGWLSGTQNIREMSGYPGGFMEGDKFRQDTVMANVYGAFYREMGPKSRLLLAMNLGYGTTDNKCAHHGHGYQDSKWDTETLDISLSAAWSYQATRSFSITPFARISYLHISNKVKEDGGGCGGESGWWWDDDDDWYDDWHGDSRWENRGSFDNLAVELGLTLEHTIRFSGGRTWTNALSGSYCPDIYRNNPHHTFNDTWWEGDELYQSRYKGKGYAPGRHAFKAKIMSRLVCSEGLSVFASYQACFRDSYVEHRAALGVAVEF